MSPDDALRLESANALLDGDDDAARTALVFKTKDIDKLIASRGNAELTYWDLNE